ncbi:MAG TPA: hypothetical protein VMF29_07370, partial [Candidatus Edwardsbacteria bacterium]|nr:hypothetical protein [Candidatus Edwardsbacteria bacterium]
LSFIGSQGLVFLQPIVQAVLNRKEYDEITLMMESRENVEKLLVEIEKQEADWQERERKEKEDAKAQRGTGNGKRGKWWSRIFGSHK